MNISDIVDRMLRQRILNLEAIGRSEKGWPRETKLWNWIEYPCGYYGRGENLQPWLMNPFGKMKQIHIPDCETAAKLYDKKLVDIAKNCRKTRKTVFEPSPAVVQSVLNELWKDAWSFSAEVLGAFGAWPTWQSEYPTIPFLTQIPYNRWPNTPTLTTTLKPETMKDMDGRELMRYFEVKK